MRKILLAYDGSEPARHAADRAAELARALGSQVEVLVVGELLGSDFGAVQPREHPEVYEARAREAEERLLAAGIDPTARVEYGDPADVIVQQAAEQGADLLVVGHRGRGGLAQLLLGSVAKRVIDEASCSVLVVR
ncbi:MAG: universal stress protein [Armatimonadetes bacterium]|nr:universal stress protein [Armatimonadota bacterium]